MLDTIFLEKAASSPVDNNKKILIRPEVGIINVTLINTSVSRIYYLCA